uniref:60S ribosomal protein L32 n=1 Tax=Rhizophora mucronata TaxID=61149 RepID=A0A2P2KES8_RHIMU
MFCTFFFFNICCSVCCILVEIFFFSKSLNMMIAFDTQSHLLLLKQNGESVIDYLILYADFLYHVMGAFVV